MERPKTYWKDYLKENKGFSGAVNSAFKNYETKYLKENSKEEVAEDFATKILVPGKIYTFSYVSPTAPLSGKAFVDKRPVILSLGRVNINNILLEGGINFNLIPHEIRIGILDRMYLAFKNQIQSGEKIIESKGNPKALPIDYDLAVKLFQGMGVETAFNVYDRRMMKTVKIIDYDDWITVGALNTKGTAGIPLNQIWSEYITKMNNKVNRLEEIKKAMK